MSTLTLPSWFRPLQCTVALRKSGLQFVSPFNGTRQAIDTLAERWIFSLGMAAAGNSDGRSAFFNQWAGGVNLVPLYHFGRPQPNGSLRGAPRLAASTARGDTSISLTGCTGLNALLGGSFETDANSDGMADGWQRYSAGTTGTLSQALYATTTEDGTKRQQVGAAGLGSGTGNRNGIMQVGRDCTHLAGRTVTFAASVAATSGTAVMLYLEFKDFAGTLLKTDGASVAATGSIQSRAFSTTVPALATSVSAWIWQHSGSGAAASLDVDIARIVPGGSAGDYPSAATLETGDMVGDGTQLYQVAEDCTASDAGEMTVPVVNRARGEVDADTLVLWDRPTALFALPAMEQATTWLRGRMVDSSALEAVEVY